MKIEIIMPKMGESVQEGTIIKWNKNVGEKVKKDEILYEISTDKVDTEVPSPAEGILKEIFYKENDVVPVETVVAILETEGEENAGESKEIASATNEKNSTVVDIPMPKMGESVMEGTIIKWNKKVGDSVKKDEILFEISTDKVDTEVPSPVEGIVAEILYKENDTVAVGETVMRIRTEGASAKPLITEVKPNEAVQEPTKSSVTEGSDVQKTDEKRKVKSNKFYSPVVLNIVREENVSFDELENIEGSGINGRVTKKDILAYLEKRESTKQLEVKESEPEVPEGEKFADGRVTIIPIDRLRRRIMEHMVQSRDTSVHVSQVMEADVSTIYNYLKTNQEKLLKEKNVKLTYMAFISYAVVQALKQFPLMNASIEEERILVKNYINLGIAVAVEPNGLIVPNIKNAENLSVLGLANAIADLGYRARNKALQPDDVVNGTFSITNYGVFGSLFGAPIINQPEVGILGVGAVTRKPVVVEVEGQEAIVIKPMLYLSLSHDHRLVDGMLGGRFLKAVKENLENFDVSMV
jgi:pyruvate dehydrogenase E2 component (dihydrolipoamide acetyltransferase)